MITDFKHGILISFAPLRDLVAWKETEKMWNELVRAEDESSAMSE